MKRLVLIMLILVLSLSGCKEITVEELTVPPAEASCAVPGQCPLGGKIRYDQLPLNLFSGDVKSLSITTESINVVVEDKTEIKKVIDYLNALTPEETEEIESVNEETILEFTLINDFKFTVIMVDKKHIVMVDKPYYLPYDDLDDFNSIIDNLH